jgi:ribulose-phosphate 3-epimerase
MPSHQDRPRAPWEGAPNRPLVAPSILSADWANLASEVAKVEGPADLLHVDVMDGHFVPNLTIGPPVVAALRPRTALFLDCHLMVDNPETLFAPLADAGAGGCSVHIELGDPTSAIERMRGLGLRPGLVLNPPTPFEAVEPYLEAVDLLLVMSVNPGFGGQRFIGEVLPKLDAARAIRQARGLAFDLQIDGGIDPATAARAVAAGADILVAGSAVFHAPDPASAIAEIRRAGAGALPEPGSGARRTPPAGL